MEQLMASVSDAVDPEKFGEVVKGAAESFTVPVGQFGDHVGKFDTVITKLIKQQNTMLKMMGESRGADYSGIPTEDK